MGVATAGIFEDVVGLAFGGGAPARGPGAARAFGLEIAYHNRRPLPEAVERMFDAVRLRLSVIASTMMAMPLGP